jgi:transcriptional regulator with XRE-family HTH domain
MRKQRALTLEALARLSGVSRSMLSQIERGQASPTLGTIWALAEALHTDVSELIGANRADRRTRIDVATSSYTPQIRSEDGLCVLKILSPADRVNSVEWYELCVKPGGALRSDAHARGTMEHLTVLTGELWVEAGSEKVLVSEGSTARYPVDLEHSIVNSADRDARALLVVLS